MKRMWWFVAGLFVGGFMGFLTAALMCAAGKRDDPGYPKGPNGDGRRT